jgi:hypothetical protein
MAGKAVVVSLMGGLGNQDVSMRPCAPWRSAIPPIRADGGIDRCSKESNIFAGNLVAFAEGI